MAVPENARFTVTLLLENAERVTVTVVTPAASAMDVALTLKVTVLMDSPLLKEWNKLHNRASKRADKRNELVHFMVIGGSGKPGETSYHLRPNIFDAKSALHYQAKGGIPEYTTKQLVEKAASFGRLAMKIDAFAYLLRGEKVLWHDKYFPPEVRPREKDS